MLGISTDTWLPLVALVAGYVGSLVTEAFRDRRQTERERLAREAERDGIREARQSELRDRHREFQRQTLVELQEALHKLGRAYSQVHLHDQFESRKAGKWVRTLVGEDVSDLTMELERLTSVLVVRVEDAEVRGAVQEMKDAASGLVAAGSQLESEAAIGGAMLAFQRANDRIGRILRGMETTHGG